MRYLITVHENLFPRRTCSSLFSCPHEYLLTALRHILNGLFCQIPHCGQSPPHSPAIPPVSRVPSVRIHSPAPSKSINLIHQCIYQSQLQFFYHGRLVDLPASPQCGCISVPCCALCGSVSWQQTTAMTGLQGRESLLLRSSLAQARVADILSHSWRVL